MGKVNKQRIIKFLWKYCYKSSGKPKNIPKCIKPLDVKLVFTFKDNDINKARLVFKGFRQIKGIDYTCTYSSTIEMDNFWIYNFYFCYKDKA